MGSGQGDIVLAEVESSESDSLTPSQEKVHRKHSRKKGGIIDESKYTTVVVRTSDDDIVTPYRNGHYPGYSRLAQRYSSVSGLEDIESGEEDDEGTSVRIKSYGDYLTPPPPLQRLLIEESSVNNAITVAPSRTNLNDSNVFAGGRVSNNLPKRHRNNNRHGNKHRVRSRTPDFTVSNHRLRMRDEPHPDSQSILNQIDLSIRKNFGDWDNEDSASPKIVKPVVIGKPQRVPFFIPKNGGTELEVEAFNDLNLPRLFKPYESEVNTSRKVLHDKTFKVAMSRDNEDPNSILSQAKKTLSFVSGQT